MVILKSASLVCISSLIIFVGCSLSVPDHFHSDAALDSMDDTTDTGVEADVQIDPPVDVPFDLPLEPDIAVDPMEIIDMEVHEIIPDRPIDEDVACMPDSRWCTIDGNMEVCNHDGTGTYVEPCPFGCSDMPEVHCLEFIPSNVGDPALLCMPGTTTITASPLADLIYVDTDRGGIYQFDEDNAEDLPPIRGAGEGLIDGINFTIRPQPSDAPSLAVFSVQRLHVPAGVMLFALGENALVILSCEDVLIEGIVEVGSVVVRDPDGTEYVVPGPGGGYTGTGQGRGGDGSAGGSYTSGGGGGGGFGGSGGNGGAGVAGDSRGEGGAGGTMYGMDELVPLYGGSGGGRGADNGMSGLGYGGPAGGALQISTPATITLVSNGIIDACGWGGIGAAPGGAGGGGGSGGAILLEAATITVSPGSFLASNGGGGGSSGVWSSTYGTHGERGNIGLDAAPGGAAPSSSGCRGGNGNSGMDINGETPPCENWDAGGGGGGAGKIRLNGFIVDVSTNTTSPSMSATPTSTTQGEPTLR